MSNQKKILLEFIRKNPNATYKEIRKKTKIHPERIFKTIKVAFEEAGVIYPRNVKKKTKEEKRKIVIEYIQKNPQAGGHTIKKDTKINFQSVFKNTKEVFDAAGIEYPRKINTLLKKRTQEQREKLIVDLVKENPLISISEIAKKTKIQPYHLFKNVREIYKKAGIKEINNHDKRTIKKQKQIIRYIKNNPLATQREINKNCKTHVQQIFHKGLVEAYEYAGIKFPFERLKLYGVGIKEIRERANNFEREIAIKLSGYGKVNRLVKTKRGFADIIFERGDKKMIIEVKDYINKEISRSQIKQLNIYLEDCGCFT
jgi:predicted HTH transcriptional regulator